MGILRKGKNYKRKQKYNSRMFILHWPQVPWTAKEPGSDCKAFLQLKYSGVLNRSWAPVCMWSSPERQTPHLGPEGPTALGLLTHSLCTGFYLGLSLGCYNPSSYSLQQWQMVINMTVILKIQPICLHRLFRVPGMGETTFLLPTAVLRPLSSWPLALFCPMLLGKLQIAVRRPGFSISWDLGHFPAESPGQTIQPFLLQSPQL